MSAPRAFVAPLLAAVLAVIAGPNTSAKQATATPQQQPTFPAEVELVVVDATVVDRQGQPIRGLGAADFTVLEDGQRQDVGSFEAIEVPEPSPAWEDEPAERPRVSTNARDTSGTGRTFVVVFDNRNLAPGDAHRAKGAVARFLEQGAREGDRVMLVATEGDAWWSVRMERGRSELLALLQRLEGRLRPDLSPERITPWEAMRIHVYRDQDVAYRVLERLEKYNAVPAEYTGRSGRQYVFDHPLLTSKAAAVYIDSVNRNRATLELLDRILASLEGARGRKSVLLVSGGFVYDSALPEFRRVPDSARRSNVVVYFVDARGLEGMPVEMTAQFGMAPDVAEMGRGGLGGEYLGGTMLTGELASEGAQTLANDSGGFTIKNANDLGAGIERIARESQVYYLLGYRPRNLARDGAFRRIEVKVARPGASVRARKGYYAAAAAPEAAAATGPAAAPAAAPKGGGKARDAGFQRALDSPLPLDAIPLRMSALVFGEAGVGRASVLVAGEVDVSGFGYAQQEGRFTDELEYLVVVAHRDSGEHFRHDESVELSLSPATREALARNGYLVARRFDLAPGGYQTKLVVRDRNSGRIGSVVHEFDVPKLDALRTSTPLVTDQVQPGAERPRPVLRVRRTFSPGATLYCEYEVYGAALPAPDAPPQVVAGYEIRRPDGAVVSRVEPTPMRPTSLGKLSRLIAAPLARMAPGRYELVLHLRDELARRELEVREPFEVKAAGS